MFAGAVLGWFVLIPAIVSFGGESILYPGTVPIATLYNGGGASAIWSSYIRYIGAGAVAAGGPGGWDQKAKVPAGGLGKGVIAPDRRPVPPVPAGGPAGAPLFPGGAAADFPP